MLGSVLKNYGSLSLIRVLSRMFEFLLKTYLIRNLLDKQILGHMVNLDLIVTISLHMLKSCLKPAYQKVKDSSKIEKNIFSGMNIMNLGILTTSIFSFIVCFFQLYHYQQLQTEKRLLNLNYCIILYGISVIFEACYQKYNVTNVLQYHYVKSAIIQMASFLPKTLFIFIATQTGMFQTYGILVFGIGHFLYSFLLFIISFFSNKKQYRLISLAKIKTDNTQNQLKKEIQKTYYVDQNTKEAAKQFFTLSILKLGIQQFQKISLVALDVISFSSNYTLVSNLGSIVVRYVFAPIQQIVYNYFSRGDQKQSVKTLIQLIKYISLFSFLALSFGYNYSEAFLGFLYGEKWVDGDSIKALQIYTILLSIIGINGVMEAFLFAKGAKSFKSYKYFSIIPTLVYIFFSFYLINYSNLGTGSFFIANATSMLIRISIAWNLQVHKHIHLKEFLLSIKPSNLYLISLIFTFLLGNPLTPYFGIKRLNNYLKDMIVGGLLFGLNMCVIIFQNREFIRMKMKKILSKRIKNQ